MPDATETRSAVIGQLLAVGRPERAEQLARDVLAADPDEPLVLCLLGEAQLAQDRPADAVESARRAVRLAPGHPEPHRFLAVAAAAADDRPTAEAALDTAVRLAPMSPAVHQTRAQVLLGFGRKKQALESAYSAVRLAPDQVGPAVVLAACLMESRLWAPAEEEADRALRIDPDDVAAQRLGASLAILRGRDDAVDRSRRALAMRPADADTRRLVVASLQTRYPVMRSLVRFETWLNALPAGTRWFVRLAPLIALRVLVLLHSTVASLLAVPIVLYIALTWAVGPVTMLLIMRRAETRKFLDQRQRRAAGGFGVLLLLALVGAVVGVATTTGPVIVAAIGLALWAFVVGGLSDVDSRRRRRLVLVIGCLAAVAAAASAASAGATRDVDPVVAGFGFALLAGIVSIWIVATG